MTDNLPAVLAWQDTAIVKAVVCLRDYPDPCRAAILADMLMDAGAEPADVARLYANPPAGDPLRGVRLLLPARVVAAFDNAAPRLPPGMQDDYDPFTDDVLRPTLAEYVGRHMERPDVAEKIQAFRFVSEPESVLSEDESFVYGVMEWPAADINRFMRTSYDAKLVYAPYLPGRKADAVRQMKRATLMLLDDLIPLPPEVTWYGPGEWKWAEYADDKAPRPMVWERKSVGDAFEVVGDRLKRTRPVKCSDLVPTDCREVQKVAPADSVSATGSYTIPQELHDKFQRALLGIVRKKKGR